MGDLLALVIGPASTRLGEGVAGLLGLQATAYECRRFPDGEAEVDLQESVRGRDVYVLQSTNPPVDEHLVELLLLADACRRAGADRLTGVIPYFGYARQDRRTQRRSLGARVAANIIGTAGFDRLMLIDAHTASIEGFFDVPIDHLTAVPLLADAIARTMHPQAVVVAPDLGAVKLAREYAGRLKVPMAFVQKTRLSGEQVQAHGVVGDVHNQVPVIVDDMISTGGTIAAAVAALQATGARGPMMVAATHGVLAGHARAVLRALPVRRYITADTVPIDDTEALHVEIASVAPLIATAIRRNHYDESLADLRVHA